MSASAYLAVIVSLTLLCLACLAETVNTLLSTLLYAGFVLVWLFGRQLIDEALTGQL